MDAETKVQQQTLTYEDMVLLCTQFQVLHINRLIIKFTCKYQKRQTCYSSNSKKSTKGD